MRMDMEHSEEEVRRWGPAKSARALHEYMIETHEIEQGPHIDGGGARIKRPAWIMPVLVGLLVVTVIGVVATTRFFAAPEREAVSVRFLIEPGTPLTDIVQALEDEGYIRNYWSVALLLRMQGNEGNVKAGSFTLSPTMSPSKIVAILTGAAPPREDIEVTIPEGLTTTETALRLVEAGVIEDASALLEAPIDILEYAFVEQGSCSAGEGRPCDVTFGALEGYLFPDTYRFEVGASPQVITGRFLKNFSAKFDQGLRAEARARGRSLRDLIIIASLVEEEGLYDDDRPLIAGVIIKRLDLGMLLQIDATVLYAQEQVIRAIPGAHFESVDREVTFADLEIDSPYNTYKYGGLPPGPIASPGLTSLMGALRPEVTDYLYYLHDPEGNTHFARTLEEHISNRNRYLK